MTHEIGGASSLPASLPSVVVDVVALLPGGQAAPPPRRTWKYKFANLWRHMSGCVCSGVVSSGASHVGCLVFPTVFGMASGSVTLWASPAVALGLSYVFDRVRGATFTVQKAGITIGAAFVVAGGMSLLAPHDHTQHQDVDIEKLNAEGVCRTAPAPSPVSSPVSSFTPSPEKK